MNKKILNTVLVLTPHKLQNKAVAKALNFLFPLNALSFSDSRVMKLEVADLNRQWLVKVDSGRYHSVPASKTADITISASLPVIVASQDYHELQAALNNGQIEISADKQDTLTVEAALQSLSQKKLDALVERCYAFFKLKPKPRFDIKSVSIEEIKSARDIDWLRDEAVKLESTDLSGALRLMELAHQARPTGPFIKRKVEEYRLALGQR